MTQNLTPATPDTIKELAAAKYLGRNRAEYKKQCTWNNKIARLLAKEPKSMKNFSFMPKGDVL